MQITGRFTPQTRGFGFVDLLDGPTVIVDDDGNSHEVTSIFVPPAVAAGWVDSDIVTARLEVDSEGRLNASELSLVKRPRRFIVGVVRPFAGAMVLEPDSRLANGEIAMSSQMSEALRHAEGRQIVAMLGNSGRATCTAQVTQPLPPEAPSAIRASAIVIGHGDANVNDFPGGLEAVGLDPALAMRWSLVTIGRMANGQEGMASEMSALEGPVPGPMAELVDRRNETCVTIDDEKTKDLDDAIGAAWSGDENDPVLLSVHIADAAGTIGIGSTSDAYARTMVTSSYFASGMNTSMIDPALSEGELSLIAGEDRRCVSVKLLVMPDGSVTGTDVSLSWINPVARLSYEGVQKWLDKGDLSAIVGSKVASKAGVLKVCMDALVEASRRLSKAKENRKTVDSFFTREEFEIAVDNGRLVLNPANPNPGAQAIVENAMVIANEAIANWAAENKIPMLYRVHPGFDSDRVERLVEVFKAFDITLENPDMPTVQEVIDASQTLRNEGKEEEAKTLETVAASSVSRASYSTENKKHVAMGAESYTHFTSPLRRYADLIVHRQIRAFLAGEELPYSKEELDVLASWLDYRSGGASRTQSLERIGLWSQFIPRKSGGIKWPTDAQITELTPKGARVRLLSSGVSSNISAPRLLGLPPKERATVELDEHAIATKDGNYRVGQTLPVRFDGVDRRGRFDVKPAKKPS